MSVEANQDITVTLPPHAQQDLLVMIWYVVPMPPRWMLLACYASLHVTQLLGSTANTGHHFSSTGKRLSWDLYVEPYRFRLR